MVERGRNWGRTLRSAPADTSDSRRCCNRQRNARSWVRTLAPAGVILPLPLWMCPAAPQVSDVLGTLNMTMPICHQECP